MSISTKTKWISQNAWRGYEEPINAVCGVNNTGTFSDSPCSSNVAKKELSLARKILREHNIKFVKKICATSNCCCSSHYLVVEKRKVKKAKELLSDLPAQTELLYLA